MNDQEIRQILLRILAEMVPEEDVTKLKSDVRLRDQIDLDSMDFVNFLVAVDEKLGVETPEKDYPQLATLDKRGASQAHRAARGRRRRFERAGAAHGNVHLRICLSY
jgi:acyl carrier protein